MEGCFSTNVTGGSLALASNLEARFKINLKNFLKLVRDDSLAEECDFGTIKEVM